MKILGIVVLIISTTTYGMILSARLSSRVQTLLHMRKMLEEIRDIIEYTCIETDEILEKIKSKYPLVFLGNLHNYDSEILRELIDGLGKSDRSGQLNFCEAVIRNIDRNLKAAEKEKEEKSRLYTTLGLSFGLAISIIIF